MYKEIFLASALFLMTMGIMGKATNVFVAYSKSNISFNAKWVKP